jgi:hypothetical protein
VSEFTGKSFIPFSVRWGAEIYLQDGTMVRLQAGTDPQ